MIYIKKGQANIIPLTLTEKATFSDPFYLIEFKNEFNKKAPKVYFSAPDVSGYPLRINLFELVEGSTGSKTQAEGFTELEEGEAHLNLIAGQYSYQVYESDTLTLDPAETTGRVIDSGRAVVALTIDNEDKGQNNAVKGVYK